MRRLALAVAMASAAAGLACASGGGSSAASAPPPPPFYRPEIELRNVRFAGAGMTGGAMDVVLRVYNPNDYPLRSPRVAYRLIVDKHEVAEGTYDTNVDVPARDSAVMRVPMKVGYTSVARGARSLLGDGTVDYRVLGRIHVDTPHGRLSSPYDRKGRFAPLTTALHKGSR